MIKKTVAMLMAASLLWSCIGSNDEENDSLLEVSDNEIVAQAEFVSDTDKEKTVVIRSNRSWFAHLDDLDHPVDPTDPDARVSRASSESY